MRETRKIVEAAVGSRGRIRILGVLLENRGEYVTRYALERDTGLKHKTVQSHLERLMRLGWVERTSYEPGKYRVRTENRLVTEFEMFLKRVGYL